MSSPDFRAELLCPLDTDTETAQGLDDVPDELAV
jgi:hypothetical protein